MAKRQKQPTKTCTDCIHESACRVWTDGRTISDASASQCPSHETFKESGAYLCGVLGERNRKQTNADRIRAMSDEELAYWVMCPHDDVCDSDGALDGDCMKCVLQWLKQPAEEDHHA